MPTNWVLQVLNSSSMGIWCIVMSEGKEPKSPINITLPFNIIYFAI